MTITVSCSSPFRTASTAGAMLREVGFHPDGALAAEQPHGAGLVGQAPGIGRDVVAVDADELERVGRVVDRALGHGAGALVDQAHIGPVEQEDADARIGAPQRPLHVTGFDGDHAASGPCRERRRQPGPAPARARSLASRISASRAARMVAKRCGKRS